MFKCLNEIMDFIEQIVISKITLYANRYNESLLYPTARWKEVQRSRKVSVYSLLFVLRW